jgi:hypothetical protein
MAGQYTSISESQWRVATSYRVEVAKPRNSRDLAVAGLQPGHLDHYKHVCRFVLASYNRLDVRPGGWGHVAGGVDTPLDTPFAALHSATPPIGRASSKHSPLHKLIITARH